MQANSGRDFSDWIDQSKKLIAAGAQPEIVQWSGSLSGDELDLFGNELPEPEPLKAPGFLVPQSFKTLANAVYYHSAPERFHLLYSALWRILRGERNLLEKLTDPVVHPLLIMQKQVTRDAHKMKAFVRFRRVERDSVEWYIAWHRSDHPIIRYVAPFFRDRFKVMNWSILTPYESVHWNQESLSYSDGVAQDPVHRDQVEDLWRTYYASVFNPARLKLKAMKTEMPVRYWKTMPETLIIPELVASSESRTSAMLEAGGKTAKDFIPANPSVEELRTAVNSCRGCPLYHGTTQAVCSDGPSTSSLVLVGEQPGNEEDLQGLPFVGPAGEILNRALNDAGIQRELVYITEAVKHFKHENRHGQRYHRSPSASDIAACRPWLMAELSLVKPSVLVCLGTSAAHSVIGKQVTLRAAQGQTFDTPACSNTIVTYHPAATLRHPDPQAREQAYAALVSDLRRAKNLANF